MKPKILYIGNKVSIHGKTATTIETLSLLLHQEGFNMITTSDKRLMFFRLLDMIWNVLKNRRDTDYILIDTYSTMSFWYAFFCSQLARILKIKYLPILHGGDLPQRIIKNPKISGMIFHNAYQNIAPSNYLLESFQKNGYSKVLFIPNVIEIDNYPFINRKFETPNLLWVRSFAKLYNPEMAIKLVYQLKEYYNDLSLAMVGPDKDGSLISCQKLAQELGIEVKFTGKLSKKDWIKLSESYNIFINTTHFDNTPVSVIEAMALGLPIVSTNVGGIPFLLKNNVNALLIDDNDVDGMVLSVKKLIENQEFCQNLVTNAHTLAKSFDWNVIKQQWNAVLK